MLFKMKPVFLGAAAFLLSGLFLDGGSERARPQFFVDPPDIPSPSMAEDGTEVVVIATRDKKFFLLPVTVENGKPWKREGQDGKGRQLDIDGQDFPTLAETGLHSELELEAARHITGRSIAEITESGRPGNSSGLGFLAREEDILSVLQGDNRLVKAMGLTHPRLARALFHVFNIVRFLDATGQPPGLSPVNFDYVLYNGKKVRLTSASENDCQPSIFNDEILGYYEIELQRELDENERAFLNEKYPDFGEERMKELHRKLSSLHFGEMAAFYAMRYGFYEGHTAYRADPISIAFILGLKSIEELERAFPGKIERTLRESFAGRAVAAVGEGR